MAEPEIGLEDERAEEIRALVRQRAQKRGGVMTKLAPVFRELRAIMLHHAEGLDRVADDEDQLSLDTRFVQKNGKPLWFGGVKRGKRYVSYHLMPVYVNPTLLDGLSPGLARRRQGKSCFDFAVADASLFTELDALTRAGHEDFRDRGFL